MFHDYTDSLFGTGVFNADGEEGVHQLSETYAHSHNVFRRPMEVR